MVERRSVLRSVASTLSNSGDQHDTQETCRSEMFEDSFLVLRKKHDFRNRGKKGRVLTVSLIASVFQQLRINHTNYTGRLSLRCRQKQPLKCQLFKPIGHEAIEIKNQLIQSISQKLINLVKKSIRITTVLLACHENTNKTKSNTVSRLFQVHKT